MSPSLSSSATATLSRRQILLDLLRPYRLRIVFALIALVVAAACVLLIGQGLKQVIDKGFVAGSPELLNYALLGLLGVILVMSVATYSRFYLVSWLGERITADLRRRVFSHLLTLSPVFFEQNRTGDVLSRLTNDTTQLETVIGSSVSMALRNALLLLGGLVMLAVTSLKLMALVLVAIPFVLVPIIVFGRLCANSRAPVRTAWRMWVPTPMRSSMKSAPCRLMVMSRPPSIHSISVWSKPLARV